MTSRLREGPEVEGRSATTNLNIYAQPGSEYARHVIEKCSTLQTGYQPALLWGTSGHIQTFLFGIGFVGRGSIPEVKGQRYSIVTVDGSTLHYDVYDPPKNKMRGRDSVSPEEGDASPYTFFVCPGINNSSESSYVRCFTAYLVTAGYRVIVNNHLGALTSERLTGHRIFTYAGTEDMALVFKDVCLRYPHTKLIGCGFSLGACVLTRFLGEKKERRDKFICAVSCCQGYDILTHLEHSNDWKKLRRFYSYAISQAHKKLISRHRNELFPPRTPNHSVLPHEEDDRADSTLLPHGPPPQPTSQDYPDSGYRTEIIHGQHNSNGFCLDRKRLHSSCTTIDEERLWACTSMLVLDDCYTRRVLGFETVEEMYRWMSCIELMNEIDDFPLLFLNALDDPCVLVETHVFPKNYAESHPKSIFVQTHHGGHVGFYEGGLIPNWVTWMDRLILEYSEACISAGQDLVLTTVV